ncbi:M20/M25/M40 family metallo-hydrolase, partial [Roseomonas sp. DSM 102946]|nr:M20/M25/M40 family metallo-hydrolase [Roseomonas sp. DSM 102946]
LANNPPEVVWSGYLSRGYVLENAEAPVALLREANAAFGGGELRSRAGTGLNDARFYSLFYGIPAFCYGPKAEQVHGFNERVEIESIRGTTKSIAAFVAGWCGAGRS